jgi:deoxyribodipyrimidine photo-lyase
MRRVPDAWLFEPWRMPTEVQHQCGLTVGVDVPEPVVDLAEATRTAKAALHARRADPEVKAGKKAVVDKHASRRVSGSLKRKTARQEAASVTTSSTQMGFDF